MKKRQSRVIICCRSALLAQGASVSVSAISRGADVEFIASSNLKPRHFSQAELFILDNVALRRDIVTYLKRLTRQDRPKIIVLSQRRMEKLDWARPISPYGKMSDFETLLREMLGKAETRERPAELTATQERVARLLAEGLVNKQIADRLGIAEATVRTHLTTIFRKLRVNNRTQASLVALEYFGTHPH